MSILLEPLPKQRLQSCPPLNNGDHLSAAEFFRRYKAMEDRGDLRNAELINGIVYFMSPLSFESHGQPDSVLQHWLAHYSTYATNVEHASNATLKLGRKDMPQPDGFLWDTTASNARLTSDGYIEGAPEIVAETSASSVSYDTREKLDSYLRAGVLEYIILRTLDNELDWFVLENDEYVRLQADDQGIIRSRYFKGLWLNVPAMLAHDRRAVLRTLETGFAAAGIS